MQTFGNSFRGRAAVDRGVMLKLQQAYNSKMARRLLAVAIAGRCVMLWTGLLSLAAEGGLEGVFHRITAEDDLLCAGYVRVEV